MKILSMDFGTSSLKIGVLDERLHIIQAVKKPYDYHIYDTDKVELAPSQLLDAMLGGIRDLGDHAAGIDLVAFCAFSPSGIYMDANGNLLYPIITHLDRRAKVESADIVRGFGAQRFQSITGILPFVGGASVTTLRWMLTNRPDIMKNVATYAHLSTWLYRLMTGVTATDPVNASMSGMYNTLTSDGWSETILDAVGVPKSILPRIVPAGSILGNITPGFAKMSGLRAGVPVALGTNDVASSLVGAGCTRPGSALNVCGSSEMVSVVTDVPAVNNAYYLRKAAIEGQWQYYSTMVGGFGLEWFRKQFCREMDTDDFYDAYLTRCIDEGGEGSIVRCDPYLAGDRQSLKVKRARFRGLTLNTTREEMLYALLLGMNGHIKTTLKLAKKHVALSGEMAITGGLALQSVIGMKEKLFGGIRITPRRDCSILGNAALALLRMES